MSFPLFKATAKSSWLILLIFASLLIIYMGSFIGMYNPDSTASMEEMMQMLPEELVKAMGISGIPADLTGFLGNYFYGMLVFMFPLIYVAVMGNRLMARLVDNGSMAYVLSTPVTRIKVAVTQGLYFIVSIAVLFLLLTGAAIGLCAAAQPGLLDILAFIRLNAAAFLLTCAIGSICWFFSCLFNETKYALAFGVGIPVLLYVLHIIGGIKEELGWVGSLSLYDLFSAPDILAGEAGTAGICIVFVLIALILFAGGVLIFKRKNLPL